MYCLYRIGYSILLEFLISNNSVCQARIMLIEKLANGEIRVLSLGLFLKKELNNGFRRKLKCNFTCKK